MTGRAAVEANSRLGNPMRFSSPQNRLLKPVIPRLTGNPVATFCCQKVAPKPAASCFLRGRSLASRKRAPDAGLQTNRPRFLSRRLRCALSPQKTKCAPLKKGFCGRRWLQGVSDPVLRFGRRSYADSRRGNHSRPSSPQIRSLRPVGFCGAFCRFKKPLRGYSAFWKSMVMVLPLYVQLDLGTLKLSGTVALSNQAVTGNFETPSPGLL